MAAKPPSRKRFADTLTSGQRELLRTSFEEAERERPEIIAAARQHATETAAVEEEIRRAFEILKGLRRLQKISLAEMAVRINMSKRDLTALEQAARPGVSLLVLSRYARALGKELRISLGEAAPAKPRHRKAVASA